MILFIIIGIGLLKVSGFLAICCLGISFWFGSRQGAGSESSFMGFIGILAVIGVIAPIVSYLFQLAR